MQVKLISSNIFCRTSTEEIFKFFIPLDTKQTVGFDIIGFEKVASVLCQPLSNAINNTRGG